MQVLLHAFPPDANTEPQLVLGSTPVMPGYTIGVTAWLHSDPDQTLVFACKGRHGFPGDADALTSVYARPLRGGSVRKLGMPNASGKDGDVGQPVVALDGTVYLIVGHSPTNSGANIQVELSDPITRIAPSAHLSHIPMQTSAEDSHARQVASGASSAATQAREQASKALRTAEEALKTAKQRPAATPASVNVVVDTERIAQIAADVVWDKADDRVWAEVTSDQETPLKGGVRDLIRQVLAEMVPPRPVEDTALLASLMTVPLPSGKEA